ncbi:hypothetical protein [Polynucleobacter asymbioticus]|nr:hypothetical protein [Polynucleobacter asymbioticus]
MQWTKAVNDSTYQLENIMKASDSFAILLILIALSYAVSMFVAN